MKLLEEKPFIGGTTTDVEQVYFFVICYLSILFW